MGLHQHTHEMTWRCAAIEWFDALFFCKIVARWVYLYTRSHDMTWRCVAIVGFDAINGRVKGGVLNGAC